MRHLSLPTGNSCCPPSLPDGSVTWPPVRQKGHHDNMPLTGLVGFLTVMPTAGGRPVELMEGVAPLP